MEIVTGGLRVSWQLLQESSIYVLFGIFVAGLLKVFLHPDTIVRHLGGGRYMSVVKAALLGIPLPLCSCGVLPAAASLKRQGANNGATAAFLISTPESGVDSIALTYAMLDPVMTVARPVAAFFAATVAGVLENVAEDPSQAAKAPIAVVCPVDGCCDGMNCPPELHAAHHTLGERLAAGLKYAFTSVWGDLAGWFFVGILIAGLITALIPADVFSRFLGGGISSMFLMLLVGIPIYICASGSTPIAAAMILKGVSPGAALVFLLVGPATNITSLTVLTGVLGRRATAIYLGSIALVAVLAGLVVDEVYHVLGLSPSALVGRAGAVFPVWAEITGALVLLALSIRPLGRAIRSRLGAISASGHGTGAECHCDHAHSASCCSEAHVRETGEICACSTDHGAEEGTLGHEEKMPSKCACSGAT